jgi:PAS domain S-box-containing protein
MTGKRKRGKILSETGQQASPTPVPRRAQLPKTGAARSNQYVTEISEALLVAGLHQHELTEVAENLNRQLQTEIVVRTETEKALRESEEQFRVMANNIAPMAWMANPDGYIFFYNRRWYDYTGTSLEEMLGWGWEKMHHPDHLSRVKEIWTAHLRDGRPWEDTFPLRAKDGKYRWFLSAAFPIRDPAGKILRWFGTNTDITEHMRAEEEVLRLNADLERRVIERTAQVQAANAELLTEVAERQKGQVALRDKNIELQAAAEVKDLFLANMSHELRTPLNGIIGFAEFLVDGKPGMINPKQKEYLQDILNSGRHLLQLISDILDLTRVGACKMEFCSEKFSLRKAIEETCAVSEPMARKKAIQINVNVAHNLGEVMIDQQKFKQILSNLLSNAIKFNHDGGKVEVLAEPHDTNRFKLLVHDNGIGVKSEDLGRLFNQFEQLESHTSRHYGGAGLGLALTQKLLELQGGTISVESEFGKGSYFTVVLPLVLAESKG